MNNPKNRTVQITAGDTILTATMYDNAAADDFLSLLPLTLTLTDYAVTEKVSDLPKRLSTKHAPPGHTPSVGDITYYSPWGNLALFYKDFSYSNGLIALGKLDAGIDVFKTSGPVKVKIELFSNKKSGDIYTADKVLRPLADNDPDSYRDEKLKPVLKQ
jgi:hypothetical protein